ncbi:ATP-dependent DNA helicase pfh1 [Golovinomyces cichoracearum]|uniref:ATP-dependent DNA helicase n=1 Tax=Golovinomyces cichoracearum TaxID=62708 RepID=A0A420I9B4_9PEZI|nr:ATP-dependent DNA helicase pfh1 [Golovinomyces cichoracearum]
MIARARSKTSLNNWMRVMILIIDLISTLSASLLDNLSLVAQDIKRNFEPFGGIKLLVFGDFLQLPPVSNLWHESTKWAFDSCLWKDLGIKTIEFNGNNRHSGNLSFASMLKRLRDGSSTVDDFEYIKSLAREVKYTDSIEPVRIYAKKNKVARYNSYRLSQLDAKSVILESVDTGDASMLRYCPVEEKFELKVGSQVMLVRNINERLVNRSVGTLVGFETSPSGNTVPVVNMVLGNNSIMEYKAEPVEWTVTGPDCNVVAFRIQVPLILAWSITIHKPQGRTIPRLIVDIEGVFEEGQCYVALSRCPCDSNIQVLNFRKKHVMSNQECVRFYKSVSNADDATFVAPNTG